jgi:hypothetical protein
VTIEYPGGGGSLSGTGIIEEVKKYKPNDKIDCKGGDEGAIG